MSFYDELLARHPIPWFIVSAAVIAGFLTWIIPRMIRATTRFQRIQQLKAAIMGTLTILYLTALIVVGVKLLTQSSTLLFIGPLLLFAADWFQNREKRH